jgi:osmotically-inducible protein OsmY
MKSDSDITRDVEHELKWNPEIDPNNMAIRVTDGAVTLYGFAKNFYERHQAELTVKRVAGVGAVANDLAVRPHAAGNASDPEIAHEALQAIRQELPGTCENLRVMVRNRRVVLEGVANWQYIRVRAEDAVRRVPGILDIRNSIQLRPAIFDGDIKDAIEAAFERSAVVDSDHILVEVVGSEVTLTGKVRSWVERDEAHQAAWSAPGVTRVLDTLTVRH